MTAPVLFEEKPCANGTRVAFATLNSPQTLNGVSLDMVDLLAERLSAWAQDDEVAMVVLQGAGGKAFSAGGDLHGLYHSMKAHAGQGAWANPLARAFFEREYRLDYQIHTYPKPILCWGHGIVMGGGVGLMMGASHRVVSETTRLAMPEISIGLFPDVGGTWMLNHMQGRLGLFLALTGAQLNASDALFAGVADYRLQSSDWPAFVKDLLQTPWTTETGENGQAATVVNEALLRRVLLAHAPADELAPGPLRQHAARVDALCRGEDLARIYQDIAELKSDPDPWLARAAHTMLAGAPGTARLAFTLLQKTRLDSLAEVFRTEYIAALVCAAEGDFCEGIRALLIDKDKQPHWKPATLEAASQDWVERFFVPPWPAGEAHPLADLGRQQ
ncbi:enoyl-CoA hydratase/isomerase family protein [Bordetella sp. 15P40C-2]|uniref:enoyl-CoA hydratase/isomerase family protein n=1 Tax=Bordetella sp. 15P40C-2 TaxID=2572246 RepID=UPI00132828A6|nr:enoyl-CoA hydratase/isomerase family protein [Bordetella sp. 15P40C-2]MVW73162.1 enoyl-CoA hydratase/isomerase family protein [Bordetella sp. 15P40C-2]